MVMAATVKAKEGRIWGNGLTQRVDAAVNFKEKAPYVAFMLHGKPFLSSNTSMYIDKSTGKPMAYASYLAEMQDMQTYHNISLRSVMIAINSASGGVLYKEFGFTNFTIEEMVGVFQSSMVYYGPAPAGNDIVWFDGINVDQPGIYSLARPIHPILGGSGEREGGWWMDLRKYGFEPVFFKSAYCNNNIDATKLTLIPITPPTPPTPPAPVGPTNQTGGKCLDGGPTNQTGGTCLNGGPTNQTGGTCATNNSGPQNVSTIGSQDGPQNISNVKGSNGPSNIGNMGQNGPSNQSSVKTTGTNSAPKKAENGPAAVDYQF